MTTDLQAFLDRAHEDFGAQRPATSSRFYVGVPAHHSGHCLPDDDLVNQHGTRAVDPFSFLTGGLVDRTGLGHWRGLRQPYLVFLVGDYGLGKTELIHQVSKEMWQLHVEQGLPAPLAVNLGRARARLQKVIDDEPVTALLFARVLFGTRADDELLRDQVIPAIRAGRVHLLLDGLDELVVSAKDHEWFVKGFDELLGPREGDASLLAARVLVGVRLVYFSLFGAAAVYGGETTVLDAGLLGGGIPDLHFLRLLFFQEDDILNYLLRRFGEEFGRRIFDEVEARPALLGLLSRPLLLSLFCQLAGEELAALDDLIVENEASAAKLVERFVETTSAVRLNEDQRELGPYGWDLERISLRSVEALRLAANQFGVDDLRRALRPIDGNGGVPPDLPTEMVLRSVHKCPFLRRVNVQRVEFSHKIFFDYFAAKGVLADLRRKRESLASSFDEIVLPTETRQFLRFYMDTDDSVPGWYERTKLSYGFLEREIWDPGDKEGVLDETRRTLLDAMTYPENPPDGIVQAVRTFFALDAGEDTWLHPRYRAYNYEAVAVWLAYNRIAGSPWRPRLEGRLGEVWGSVWGRLGGNNMNPELRTANELLFERVLHIGRRMYFRWAPDAARAVLDQGTSRLRDGYLARCTAIAKEIDRIH